MARSGCALSIQAFEGDHDQVEELTVRCWDEAGRAATNLCNHSSITAGQKEAGITAAEEQSQMRVCSEAYLKALPVFGELAFGFVPKAHRDHTNTPLVACSACLPARMSVWTMPRG